MEDRYIVNLNVEGRDVQVVVEDLETANILINDQIAAVEFVRNMKNEEIENIENDADNSCVHVSDEETPIIWRKKRPTSVDYEATSLLLSLRQKYTDTFNDKKTTKSALWNLISDQIKQEHYNLGKNAGERCRQKFSNLTKAYFAYIRQQKTTGEGSTDEPPYFEELHSIMGTKHKTTPASLQDSLLTNEDEVEPSPAKDEASSSTESKPNDRFKRKPKVRPPSNSEKMLEAIKEDREVRSMEFEFIKQSVKKAEEQRDRLLTILEKAYRRKGNKRSGVQSESDSD